MTKKNFWSFLISIYLLINFVIIFLLEKYDLFFRLNGDTTGFFHIASEIKKGAGIGDNIWWPPLYPIIISFFLNFPKPVVLLSIFQTFIFLLILISFYKILSLFVKKRIKTIILISIFAIIPSHLIISKIPLADSLFLFFYSWHFWFMSLSLKKFRVSRLLLASCFLILANFTKPTLLFLHFLEFMVIFIWLSLTKKVVRSKMVVYCLFLFLLPQIFYSLWSYRNYSKTGVYVFANVKNYNLLAHNFFHAYPYMSFFAKDFPFEKKWQVGDELVYNKANQLRSYLKDELLNNYLSKTVSNPFELTSNQRMYYAGKLGWQMIIKYFWIYLPIHYLKSLKLFFPNNWQLFHLFLRSNDKILIFSLDFIFGILLVSLFVRALKNFIRFFNRSLKKYNHFKAVNLLILANLFYLLSVIGPVAIDDSGRFSFVFLFFCLLFIGFNLSSSAKS